MIIMGKNDWGQLNDLNLIEGILFQMVFVTICTEIISHSWEVSRTALSYVNSTKSKWICFAFYLLQICMQADLGGGGGGTGF